MQPTVTNPNWLQRQSIAFDNFIASTGLPYITGQAGRTLGSGLGSLFGNDQFAEIGQVVGEGLPRTAIEAGPMFLIPGGQAKAVLSGGNLLRKGIAAAKLGTKAAGATSAGIRTYAGTDSIPAGIIGGASLPLMPGIAGLGERAVAGTLARGMTDAAGKRLSSRAALDILRARGGAIAPRYIGSETAINLASIGQDATISALAGTEGPSFTPEYAFELFMGNLPFYGLDVVRMRREASLARDPYVTRAVRAPDGQVKMVTGRQSELSTIEGRGQLLTKTTDAIRHDVSLIDEAYRRIDERSDEPLQIHRLEGGLEEVAPQELLTRFGMPEKKPVSLEEFKQLRDKMEVEIAKSNMQTADDFNAALMKTEIMVERAKEWFPEVGKATDEVTEVIGRNLAYGDSYPLAYAKAMGYLKAKMAQLDPAKSENLPVTLRQYVQKFADSEGMNGETREQFMGMVENISVIPSYWSNDRLMLARGMQELMPARLDAMVGLQIPETSVFKDKTKAGSDLTTWLATRFSGMPAASNRFLFTSQIVHQFLHTYFKHDTGDVKSDKDALAVQRKELLTNNVARASKLTEAERQLSLETKFRIMLTDKYITGDDGQMLPAIRGMIDFAAKDPYEFITLESTLMMTGIASGSDPVRLQNVETLIKTMDPYEAEFVKMLYRNIEGIAPVLGKFYRKALEAGVNIDNRLRSRFFEGYEKQVARGDYKLSMPGEARDDPRVRDPKLTEMDLARVQTNLHPRQLANLNRALGNKINWLAQQPNQTLLQQLTSGKTRVIDAFSGTGVFARFLRHVGFEGKIIENERHPIAFQAMQKLILDEAAVTRLEGYAKQLAEAKDVETFRTILRTIPEADADLAYLLKQRVQFMGRPAPVELDKGTFQLDKFSALRKFGEKVRNWRKENPELLNADGFKIDQEVGAYRADDLLIFDPPYLGTRTYGKTTVETGLDQVRKAVESGADVLYFNKANKQLEADLKQLGLETTIETISQTLTLVAYTKKRADLKAQVEEAKLGKAKKIPATHDINNVEEMRDAWLQLHMDENFPGFNLKDIVTVDQWKQYITTNVKPIADALGIKLTFTTQPDAALGAYNPFTNTIIFNTNLTGMGLDKYLNFAMAFMAGRHELIHAVVEHSYNKLHPRFTEATFANLNYRSALTREYHTPAQKRLVDETYGQTQSARSVQVEAIRMVVERLLYGPLSEKLLNGYLKDNAPLYRKLLRDTVNRYADLIAETPPNDPVKRLLFDTMQDVKRALLHLDPDAGNIYADRILAMTDLHKSIKDMLPTLKEISKIKEDWKTTEDFLTPEKVVTDGIPVNSEGVPGKFKEIFDAVRERLVLDPDDISQQGIKMGKIGGLLGLPSQAVMRFRRDFEPAADLLSAVLGVQSIQNGRWTEIMDLFLYKSADSSLKRIAAAADKNLTIEQRKQKQTIRLVEGDPQVARAFDAVGLYQNTNRKHFEGGNQEVPEFNALPLAMKNRVLHLRTLTVASNRNAADIMLTTTQKVMQFRAAEWFLRDNKKVTMGGLLAQMPGKFMWQKMHELSQRLWEALDGAEEFSVYQDQVRILLNETERNPGETKQDFEWRVRKDVRDRLAEQLVQRLSKELPKQLPGIENLKHGTALRSLIFNRFAWEDMGNLFKNQEWYMSERRMGQYLVSYKKGRINGAEGFHDKLTANQRMRELAGSDEYSNVRVLDKKEPSYGEGSIGFFTEDVMLRYIEVEERAYQEALDYALAEGQNSPQAHAFASDMQKAFAPGKEFTQHLADLKTKKMMKKRKLAPGREHLNMWEAAIGNWQDIAKASALTETKQLTRLILTDPSWDANHKLKGFMRDYAEEMLRPQSHEYTKFKKGVFTYWLGFNPSSLMIEATQPFLTALPEFIKLTGSAGGGWRLLGDAFIGIGNAYGKKGIKPGELIFDGDETMTKLFHRAFQDGLLQYGSMEDAVHNAEWANVNAARLRLGDTPLSFGEYLAKPLAWYSKGAATMYSLVSGTGAKISFYAGVKSGVAKGLEGEALYNHAAEVTRATVFSGGPYARPFFFKDLGPRARGLAGAAYVLNNFTFGTVHMMTRLAHEAIANTGLKPAEKTAARKAFATMMGVQFFFAGIMGYPFAAAALRILEEINGEEYYTDILGAVNEIANSVTGDEEMGNLLSDIAMNGASSRLTGVDLHSRLGLTGMLGFNSYRGFDLSDLLGATGGMFESIFKGVKQTAQGQPARGLISAMPNGFRGIMEMARTQGRFEDPNGNLLFEASTPEIVLRSLGFRPRRLTELQKMRRVMTLEDASADRKRRKEIDEMGEHLLAGDIPTTRMLLQNYLTANADNPAIDANDTINLITRRTLDKAIPLDPMRSGSTATTRQRARIAELLSAPRTPNEEQRLFLRKRLQTQLTGRYQAPRPNELMEARRIDNLMRNQHITLQEARVLANY